VGATRRQIVGQAMVESVLLAVAGGLVGLVVAAGAARLLIGLAFNSATFLPISVAPSLAVLAFAFTVALLTGLVFGAAPAWFATRTDPIDALRTSHRTTSDRSSPARTGLLILQATLSIVLVAGATMLGRSLGNLERQDFGFRRDDRVLVSLNSPPASYTLPRLMALFRDLESRLQRLPGVRGTGMALYNPLTDNWGEMVLVSGHPIPKMSEEAGSSWDTSPRTTCRTLGSGWSVVATSRRPTTRPPSRWPS
jgi:hypothetical protein